VAVHVVVLAQLTELPASSPNLALVEPGTKPVPVMVMTSPPAVLPDEGLTALTLGAAA
jgi:hypothetical protein